MTSGDLIIDQSKKMTEILLNEINESNRSLFCIFIFLVVFYLGVVILPPIPTAKRVGTATRERVKRCRYNDKSLRQCMGTTFDR